MAIKINGIKVTGGSGSNIKLDTTLAVTGAAADAKAVGDAVNNLQKNIDEISEHASEVDVELSGKADATHNHDDVYYTEVEMDAKLANKADANNIPIALSDLSEDTTHRTVTDAEKTAWNTKSDFSGSYKDLTDKPTIPSIEGLATTTYADEQVADAKSYTDIEIAKHNHDDDYDSQGSAEAALSTAKDYTDTKTKDLASTIVVDNKISEHNTTIDTHNDIRLLISDLTTKLNNFLDVDDTTADQLSEVLTLIDNNRGTLESLTTSKVNVSDIVNNLTTNVPNKPLSAAQGVVLKSLVDSITVPTKTSQLNNDSGFITSAPVTSVNGKTSAVQLGASDVGAVTMTEVNEAINSAIGTAIGGSY